MLRLFIYPLCLVLLLAPTWALADDQEEVHDIGQVTVTARGYATPTTKTPGGIGIVEAEDIKLAPKASLADSAASIPGVQTTGDSPWGKAINIRGMSGSSVIFLIDGRRINTATDINAQMGFLQPDDVERIEVLKGPLSSLYGSGSIGGVVNVITKKGSFSQEQELHGEAINSYSTNTDGWDNYGRANYSSETFWLQASGGGRSHENRRAGDTTTIDNSQYEDVQGRLAAGMLWTKNLSSEVQFMAQEGNNIGIPGGPSTMPDNAKTTYPRTGFILAGLKNVLDIDDSWLRQVLTDVYYSKNDRRVSITELGALPIKEIRPWANHETWGGKLQGEIAVGDHTAVTGLDAWNWHMHGARTRYFKNGSARVDNPTPNTTMRSVGAYVEDDWSVVKDLTINIGGRLDKIDISNRSTATIHEDHKTNHGYNAHVGATWFFTDNWSQSLLAASGYRAADIMERFKNINLGGKQLLGSNSLSPEQSRYLEYGVQHTSERLTWKVLVFHNEITDFITEEPVDANTIVMKNVGRARIQGAETEGSWEFIDQWSLYGNAAWLRGQDLNKDEPLRYVAPLNGTIGLRYDAPFGLWALAESHMAADKKNTPDDVEGISAWAIFDLAAGYSFKTEALEHEFIVRLSNLFDRYHVNYLANSRGIELAEQGFNAAFTYSVRF